MKICTKCKKEKDLNEFSPDKKSKNGRKSICKKCINEQIRRNYKNPEIKKKKQKYFEKWKRENPKKWEKIQKKHRNTNKYKEKNRLRQEIRYHNDTDFRERVKKRNLEYYHRKKLNDKN